MILSVPGFPEAASLGSCSHVEGLIVCIVVGLGFGGRDTPDGAEEEVVVEPVIPAQDSHFHGQHAGPGSLPPNHSGLVKAYDRLGQSAVIT